MSLSKPIYMLSFPTGLAHPIGIQHCGPTQALVRGEQTEQIKRFDITGKHIETLSSNTQLGRSSGMIVLDDKCILYSDLNNKIIHKIKEKVDEHFIHTEWYPTGMTRSRKGDFLVCMAERHMNMGDHLRHDDQGRVERYSLSGIKLQEIYKFNDENLFLRPICICENINNDICVSDCLKKEVIVTDCDGNFRFSYNGNHPFGSYRRIRPTELDTDSMGNILICDWHNHIIHMVSMNGETTKYFLSSVDGIQFPRGLTIDASDKLWITEQNSGKVKVFIYHGKSYGS